MQRFPSVFLLAVLVSLVGTHPTTAEDKPEIANSLGMRLIPFAPGEYIRGAKHGDLLRKNHPFSTDGRGSHDARPAHRVKLTKPFLIAATEVTVGQFKSFVEATGYKTSAETNGQGALAFFPKAEKALDQFALNPDCTWRNPSFQQKDNHPVVCVSWKDAVAFCEWLSKKEKTTY
ncbi:MAG: SUMF1/EgtB/PvdO family nonheme iron enzyme, partial [Planctomycetaceae bacterium]|nr:SUMF1/EgtB/PvdO family nonheme iron enzyme [Planctomycetaceae bacterium]